jgi:dipeptidyl aminopeptidase/acylaminoacyl peptidase
MSKPRLCALVLALCSAPLFAAGPSPITLEQAMAHPDWIGPPVEAAWWSGDGRRVYYTLRREASTLRDTWVQPANGGEPVRIEGAALAELEPAGLVFDRERRRAVFLRNGDVFLREAQGGLRQLTRGSEAEADPQFSADQRSLLFRRDHDWFRYEPASGLLSTVAQPRAAKDPNAPPAPDALRDDQLRLIGTLARERQQREAAREQDRLNRLADPTRPPPPVYLGDDIEIAASSLSPDGRWLLLAVQAKGAEEGRGGRMPRYVTESGYEDMEDVRTRVGRNPPIPQTLRLVNLRDGSVRRLALSGLPGIAEDPLAELRRAARLDPLAGERSLRVEAFRWSDDGARVAIMLRSVDNKDRWIAGVDFAAGRLRALHRLTDPGWINWNFNDYGWLPDNRTLWYLSEESGWSHLYVREGEAAPRQLTSGRWEASAVQWSADGRTAYFVCNRAWPGDYEVCSVGRGGGEVRELTALDGVEDFSLSPDGARIALRWSASYVPPQLAVLELGAGRVARLTDTRSAAYREREWIPPQYVQVPSRHGAGAIWGKLYLPPDMQPGRRYPIVMFVHGAGYLQNVFARYPVYFREQMFHNLLAQEGYIVLDLDYRASEGYGRDWRTAIYRRMGHPELEDYLDGIEWLVAGHQGDRDRVGIYGGSYGGFMAFMALFRAPEAFRAGAALRPVSDWRMYNHEYTSNILNTPELDPEAYRISSPIEYAQNLQGRLLIAHGMIDDNVFYQDSVRLAQRLIELRKPGWELASYPLERHAYQHPESWYDQYRRIHELFRQSLREPAGDG